MMRSAKLQAQSKRREIWQGIVDYVNADFSKDAEKALRSLEKLVGTCEGLSGVWEESGINLWAQIEEVRVIRANAKGEEEEAWMASIRLSAMRHQDELRKVLTWICAPKENVDLAHDAVDFLQRGCDGISWRLDFNNEFDEAGEDGYPIFFFRFLERCESVVSPVCVFLRDRLWEFQEGDLPLTEAVPIRMCANPGCGRFKLPERDRTPCYCSGRCRSAHFQRNKSADDKAERVRGYRKLPPTVKTTKRGGKGGAQRK
jgi:hypothetical protein